MGSWKKSQAENTEESPDIILNGLGIKTYHCQFQYENN